MFGTVLRKCAPRPQICLSKYAAFVTYATSRIRRNVLQCVELKDLRLVKSQLTVFRRYSSESDNKCYLPELTNLPLGECTPYWYFLFGRFFAELKMKIQADPDFKMSEFIEGCQQAIMMVSQALANKNYEILQDVVKPSTLELLISRINTLNAEERKLIAVRDASVIAVTSISKCDVVQHRGDDLKRVTATIQVLMFYANGKLELTPKGLHLCVCCYEFEREYRDAVGSQWQITNLNHGSTKNDS